MTTNETSTLDAIKDAAKGNKPLPRLVQPGETPPPVSSVLLPDTLAGWRLDHLRDNKAIKWCANPKNNASPQLRACAASVLKEAVAGEPEAALAKNVFLELFPSDDTVFDGAVPADLSYFEFRAQGLPKEEEGDGGSPLGDAHCDVYGRKLGNKLLPTHGTACAILRLDESIVGGVLEFNLMRDRITVDRRDVNDNDINVIRERIEQRVRTWVKKEGWKGLAFSFDTLAHAIAQVAWERRFHPVQEYLKGLRWDGKLRLDRVATELLHGPMNDFARRMVRKFLISCVARALEPGCKVDTMLVLYGEQGFLKSSFLKCLAGEDWFSDRTIDFDNRDDLMAMRRAWICEWSEMTSLFNARTEEDIKAGLTRTTDTYRRPYGRTDIDSPRHTVFAGTTNRADILTDVTGNRRYWPITVEKRIDLDKVRAWRDQIWAEAVVAFWAGETWWLDEKDEGMLKLVQNDFEQFDEWTGNVLAHLNEHPEPQLFANIAKGALGLNVDKLGGTEQNRLRKILRKAGWAPRKLSVNGVERRLWAKSPTPSTAASAASTPPSA